MSTTALLDRPAAPARHLHAVPTGADIAPHAPAPRPATPAGASARGFALYVGIDEQTAAAAGVSLGTLVQALRQTLHDLAPGAESHATVALAPETATGRSVDLVRLALREPAAVARATQETPDEDRAPGGVEIDISRKRVVIDGVSAGFTYKEFELVQYLVLREGRTIERGELVDALWDASSGEEAPGERTIDVHVRRLRAKLGRYEDIVRTVRGVGYRFDRHADVVVRFGTTGQSPDRF